MEIDNILHYLLIGDLTSGKIIYEMSNTTDAKTIYDINQIFNTYYKQHQHRPENTKVDSYYITITVERKIMISKTDENFPFKQNFELFKKIIDSVPELSQLSLNHNLALNKNNIKSKISDAIYGFFNDINYNNQQIVNTISYNRYKNKINKNYTNNYYNEDEKIKNSLISNNRSFDADKYSFTQMIQDKPNNSIKERNDLRGSNQLNKFNKNKRISVKIIDENNEEKTNISKSLIRSSLIINNSHSLNKSGIQPAEMSYSLLRELQNLIWQITCCKKIIILFLIIIIIAQIIIIPIIINKCYSY